MEVLIKTARVSYGIMVAGLATQQIFYKTFRPVILPPWQLSFPGFAIFVYVASAFFIIAGAAIVFNRKVEIISLILGGLFLFMFLFCQVPYELFANPNYMHLGEWAQAEKELVLAGGGFVIAGLFPLAKENDQKKTFIINLLEKMIPFGSVLTCVTMVSFGLDHFFYTEGVSTLVPTWIPGAMFWTYFAGAALVCSGVAILLRIKLKLSALLLSSMIFIWVFVLHIPRAIADPYGLQGNEVSSVFEAFGFSGVAYLIGYGDSGTRNSDV